MATRAPQQPPLYTALWGRTHQIVLSFISFSVPLNDMRTKAIFRRSGRRFMLFSVGCLLFIVRLSTALVDARVMACQTAARWQCNGRMIRRRRPLIRQVQRRTLRNSYWAQMTRSPVHVESLMMGSNGKVSPFYQRFR